MMTKLERQRLEDFKKVLTYHLVAKIHYSFKDHYKMYFEAPHIWQLWKAGKLKYDKRIYELVIMFNQTALSAHQVQSIFGKDEAGAWISYPKLIACDKTIKVFNKGSICIRSKATKKVRRFQVKKRYQIAFEDIARIFDDETLLNQVLDASSDYYTSRQRRLIFSQINDKKKNYHYKTAQEALDDVTDQEKIDALFEDEGDWL